MRKPKIYLDTSVVSFLFADDSPQFKEYTQMFFENKVKEGYVSAYASEITNAEIENTRDSKRKAELRKVFETYPIQFLKPDDEQINDIELLVKEYMIEGCFSERQLADAYHVAFATIFEMDILLSWNFRHLSNANKENIVQGINHKLGYIHPLRLLNPIGVIDEN